MRFWSGRIAVFLLNWTTQAARRFYFEPRLAITNQNMESQSTAEERLTCAVSYHQTDMELNG